MFCAKREQRNQAVSQLRAGAECQEKPQTPLLRVKCFYLTSPFIELARTLFSSIAQSVHALDRLFSCSCVLIRWLVKLAGSSVLTRPIEVKSVKFWRSDSL